MWRPLCINYLRTSEVQFFVKCTQIILINAEGSVLESSEDIGVIKMNRIQYSDKNSKIGLECEPRIILKDEHTDMDKFLIEYDRLIHEENSEFSIFSWWKRNFFYTVYSSGQQEIQQKCHKSIENLCKSHKQTIYVTNFEIITFLIFIAYLHAHAVCIKVWVSTFSSFYKIKVHHGQDPATNNGFWL
ncbi:hypothetical protein C0J52_02723 [Blattella germanica]|nr:hypothetical protein C0J52_02723 [Blattella germanica]